MGAKWNYTLLALLAFVFVKAQVNLVHNPSFEEYNQCPEENNCDIANLPFWGYSNSLPAYLNICNFSNTQPIPCAAPFSTGGGGCLQYPQDGNGYALIENYIYPSFFYRSQLQTKLIKPLDSLQCYYFSMYINLCDSCIIATDDIGVLFVKNNINLNTPNPVENFPTPQIFHSGVFIQEKEYWFKYEGSFIATGGEEYMLIGSFSNPDSIDIVFLPYGEQNGNQSTYIIDNITLIECDSLIGVNEMPYNPVSIYPNPAQGFVSIELPKSYNQAQLNIYNITGQLIAQKQITQSNQQIPITELGNGMYIFVIQNGDRVIGRQRVVVAR